MVMAPTDASLTKLLESTGPKYEHVWLSLQWHAGFAGMGKGWDKPMTAEIERLGAVGFEMVAATNPRSDPRAIPGQTCAEGLLVRNPAVGVEPGGRHALKTGPRATGRSRRTTSTTPRATSREGEPFTRSISPDRSRTSARLL